MDVEFDPELTKEVIRLLGQELKATKSQLAEERSLRITNATPTPSTSPDALSIENRNLKAQLETLQSSLEASQKTKPEEQSEPEHKSTITKLEAALSDLNSQLADALAAKQELITANESLEAKYTALQEEYTVDSPITHSGPWTPRIMGFGRVWDPGKFPKRKLLDYREL